MYIDILINAVLLLNKISIYDNTVCIAKAYQVRAL
jgi:hypothetical protein